MSARIDVGVLGATGVVGQQIVARLARHPWFRVAWLGASERSVGRRYGDLPWRAGGMCPPAAARLSVEAPEPRHAPSIVFSALDAATASTLEPQFAASGRLVVSNASAHRMRPDVPLIVPEINPHDIRLVEHQPWSGSLITNPNCSSVFLALALAPLVPFGLRAVTVSTLQALSGAGYPGVASLDALANVVPFIAGEEEKLETEPLKILGARVPISAQATRVPVVDGHTLLVSVAFEQRVEADDLRQAWSGFQGPEHVRALPAAPARPLVLSDLPDRPQPRLDAGEGDGMSVTIGRLRACAVLDWRFVALGHNLVRGAAGAAILNAELAVATGAAGAARMLEVARDEEEVPIPSAC